MTQPTKGTNARVSVLRSLWILLERSGREFVNGLSGLVNVTDIRISRTCHMNVDTKFITSKRAQFMTSLRKELTLQFPEEEVFRSFWNSLSVNL